MEIKNGCGESYRSDPTFRNVMHCLVFVIKATTNLNNSQDETLNKIKAIQRKISGSRNVSPVYLLLIAHISK